MVVIFSDRFQKQIQKHSSQKKQLFLLIAKVMLRPEIGKPMRHSKKGTREVYLGSFRISYKLNGKDILFAEIYHKDEQ